MGITQESTTYGQWGEGTEGRTEGHGGVTSDHFDSRRIRFVYHDLSFFF